tara:strand:- start:550 stop:1455 length:906 start_codon:yes stop_codon:yes gene_type:complete
MITANDDIFSPTLAVSVKDFEAIKYPVYATPKIDGWRCTMRGTVATTRSLKLVPNVWVRQVLAAVPDLAGMDGEIWVPGGLGACNSAFNSKRGKPTFTYYPFDEVSDNGYLDRITTVADKLAESTFNFIVPLIPDRIENAVELQSFLTLMLQDGHEGVCLRSAEARYKYGRSTLNEQILLRIKPFQEREATIVDVEEMERNNNTPFLNELGRTARSSAITGKVRAGMMGKLVVQDTKVESWVFRVGTGFDQDFRMMAWQLYKQNPNAIIGRTIRYKYQDYGTLDVPRIPVYLGFRDSIDLS